MKRFDGLVKAVHHLGSTPALILVTLFVLFGLLGMHSPASIKSQPRSGYCGIASKFTIERVVVRRICVSIQASECTSDGHNVVRVFSGPAGAHLESSLIHWPVVKSCTWLPFVHLTETTRIS